MATYRLDDSAPHTFWDQALAPRLTVKPGDTVVFETLEASANQITPKSKAAALARHELREDPPADRAGVRPRRRARRRARGARSSR